MFDALMSKHDDEEPIRIARGDGDVDADFALWDESAYEGWEAVRVGSGKDDDLLVDMHSLSRTRLGSKRSAKGFGSMSRENVPLAQSDAKDDVMKDDVMDDTSMLIDAVESRRSRKATMADKGEYVRKHAAPSQASRGRSSRSRSSLPNVGDMGSVLIPALVGLISFVLGVGVGALIL